MTSIHRHLPSHHRQSRLATVALCALLTLCGCHRSLMRSTKFAKPVRTSQLSQTQGPLRDAEAIYAAAVALDKDDSSECLDSYLRCCQLLWPQVIGITPEPSDARAVELYDSSIGRFVEAAIKYGSLDFVQGVQTSSRTVPIKYTGLPWRPEQFEQITTVGDYDSPHGMDSKTQTGLGVPIVARLGSTIPYQPARAAAAVTLLIRPVDGTMVMEMVNPLLVRHLHIHNSSVPIAYDLTAPFPYYNKWYEHAGLQGFLRPGENDDVTGLALTAPYQKGKIPVVFVHGLASDPMTWASLANELFVYQDVVERYQFLIYSYPSGKPFPVAAARLREQLVDLRNQVDPDHQDGALDNIVLVGHSMGGLVSKLQTTHSGHRISQAVFNKPFAQLELTPDLETEVRETLFFDPSSQVKRVIFIATPHKGSKLAVNPLGRLASKLVNDPADLVSGFATISQLNGEAIIGGSSRIPTSVDLLQPDNPVLQAIYNLPSQPTVKYHSIIGVGGRFGGEPSDGVVSVSSARHPNVQSELMVDATHTTIHHHPETVDEVVRILRHHHNSPIGRHSIPIAAVGIQ